MSDARTELVIQISTERCTSESTKSDAEMAEECRFAADFQRWLWPGVEIAIVFGGYTALTSILWLAGPLPDGGLRAGVRLLGVSTMPIADRVTVRTPCEETPEPAAHDSNPPAIRHGSVSQPTS